MRREQELIALVEAAASDGSLDRDGIAATSRRLASLTGHSDRSVRRKIDRLLEDRPMTQRETYSLDDHALAVYASCGFNAAAARRRLQQDGAVVPSLRTFQRAAERQVPVYERTYGTAGVQEARKHLLVLPRPEVDPNDEWEWDNTAIPVRTLDGAGVALDEVHLSMIIDRGSRALVAWEVIPARPSAADQRRILARAIAGTTVHGGVRLGGLARTILIDQGADFMADEVQHLAGRHKIAVSPLPPYRPDQKGNIERVNHTLVNQFLADLPGRTDGPATIRGRSRTPADAMTLADLTAAVDEAIVTYNTQHLHSAIGTTPASKFSEAAVDFPSVSALRSLLPLAKSDALVRREGIQCGGHRYSGAALQDHVRGVVELRGDVGAAWLAVYRGTDVVGIVTREDLMTADDRHEIERKRAASTAAAKSLLSAGDAASRERYPHVANPPAPRRTPRRSQPRITTSHADAISVLKARTQAETHRYRQPTLEDAT